MKWMKLNPRIPCVCVNRVIVRMLSAVVVAMQLMACGGGGGGSTSGTNSGAGKTLSAADVGSSSSSGMASPSDGSQTGTGATGNLTLSWVAPATRTDGTPLSLAAIDGFRIYYGTSEGEYTHSVNIPDSTTQQVVLKDLAVGTYYLVMTTYDVDGRESSHSAVVMKTVS
jgi:hypothetical protein